jgi:hypothetical protein
MNLDPYAELRGTAEAERLTRLMVRCANPDCGKLLAEMVTAPWQIRCPRCKSDNRSQQGPW